MMQDRGEDYEKKIPPDDIPRFHPQHPGGTCVFRGIGYSAEWQCGKGVSVNDASFVEEYETKMLVPLRNDINPAKVITSLDMFRNTGILATCNGLEKRVRISSYTCHQRLSHSEVFKMMDSGTVFLGTFPVRRDFIELRDGIYHLYPPLQPNEILENHLVMFVSHGKKEGHPFLVFINDRNRPSRLGRVYFNQVYQIPGLKHFSLISVDAGQHPAASQAAASPPPPLGPPRGPSRRPPGFQGDSPAYGPAQPGGRRQASKSTRQGLGSGQGRRTADYHQDADLGFGSAQAKDTLDHLESVLANEPETMKSGQHIVEVKPQVFKGALFRTVTEEEEHTCYFSKRELRERIKPYFLCRMKSDVFADIGSADDKKLSKKNELIVWLKLTACQRKLYEAFLNSDIVHSSKQGSPLAAITILKKICDHPMILTKRAAEDIMEGMDGMHQDMGMLQKMAMNLADMAYDVEAQQVEEEIACKLSFIKSLLKLLEEGHHVLIFSQTCKMINLIQIQLLQQEAILLEGYKCLCIDGTTKERERIVKDFQEGSGAQIFLLAKQVGGLGLTFTKAARVIVVDPAWNSSTYNQAVDCAYQIGQAKHVILYCLMTCGTIEEKICKSQVFKGALFRADTEQKEQTRYFSKRDMQEVFSLPEQGFDVSLTQKQLQVEHRQQLVKDESLREQIEFLEQIGIAGVSNHSLLFSKTAVLSTLSEHDALDRKPPNTSMIARQYNKASSSDYVANGAAHAFKPKDFTPSASAASSTKSEIPEEIKKKINRLSQTLANTTLVSRLLDRSEKQNQIHQLDEKLTAISRVGVVQGYKR